MLLVMERTNASTPPRRGESRPLPGGHPDMTGFQRLLLVTIAATFILVVIGGTVRATDSGLGCR